MSNFLNEFKNPSAQFRGAPFWAWNCRLEKEQLMRQMEYFQQMGFGGATIHCRTGLDTPYMGKEFMSLVKTCVNKAEKLKMKIYLYDEDRWPSGFGGGAVTKNINFRSRHLVFTKVSPEEMTLSNLVKNGSNAEASIQGDGVLIAKYEITLSDGYLTSYHRMMDGEQGENIWYAYREVKADNPWFNNQAYVDTFNKDAIDCFIKNTHDKYAEALGDKFGDTIPSIFTDEPQFTHKMIFGRAEDTQGIVIPYTDDLEATYQKAYGESLLEHLPEVFWELSDHKISVVRYRYHDHLAERFAQAYSDTVGKWCNEHHIALTGHMMEEPTLLSQTHALGEAMRHYRGFKIPGIDMLCDNREYNTAKQAQSASHQMGSNEMSSELYGVTNWDFDFRGHKLQGDWQAALGVTHRVHHLSWVSMEGEAKRDYPASISYQSPWYEKYSVIEDYFARVNTALMSGTPNVRIGVIHPVESFWLYFGPDEQTKIMRDKLEKQFSDLTQWLLFGLLDFDFISEALWNSLDSSENSEGIRVGEMIYDVIVVPGLITYRASTIKRLENFVERGGKIIFMGEPGRYVDALESNKPEEISKKGIRIHFDEAELLNTLSQYREIDVMDMRGVRSNHYIYQMRKDGDNKIVFLANACKNENPDIPAAENYLVVIKGLFQVEILDAMSGERKKIHVEYKDGNSRIMYNFYEEDSLLLYLSKSEIVIDNTWPLENKSRELVKILNTVNSYQLSEPNVFMLDQAEYSLDGEDYAPMEEILRIDNLLRERLGYPLKMEAYAQPWTRNEKVEKDQHKLKLRYTINSEIDQLPVMLAVETSMGMEIIWNQKEVEVKSEGYYVDENIHSYHLPNIQKGKNELIIELDYNRWSNLEWCYLLGDFGVYVYGNKATVTPLKAELGFSNLTSQGLAFYGGNISYQCLAILLEGEYVLEVTKFRAPLLSIKVDGKEAGNIMFSPYSAYLGHLMEGQHTIEILCYGNRINTFGTVHNCNENTTWFGPEAWRSTGAAYSYEYQLKYTGVLSAPKLFRI